MELELWFFITLIILAFFIVGFWKKQSILVLLSGIGFILQGVWLLNGLKYVTSYTVVETDNVTSTITNNYTSWSTSFTSPLFIVLILVGLFFIFIAAFDFWRGEPEKEKKSDDEGEDE